MENLSLDTIIESASVIVAISTFLVANQINKRKELRLTRKDIYLSLELSSIDLFRFEADNIELTRPLWEEHAELPDRGTAEREVFANYVCQNMNIMELALSFRLDGTMPPKVFGSWVDWYHKLASAPGFPRIYPELRNNYSKELCSIFDFALTHKSGSQRAFYHFVSELIGGCGIVRDWKSGEENEEKSRPAPMTFTLEWHSDEDSVDELTHLFLQNTTTDYISHSEIIEGRAISEKQWSADLESIIRSNIKAAIDKGETDTRLVLAKDRQKVLGFAIVEFDRQDAILADIVVKAEQQQTGVGKVLLAWLKGELKNEGFRFLFAESGLVNRNAHAFLERNGFQTVSKVFMSEL